VFGHPRELAELEAILHPMVRERRTDFFRTAALSRRRVVAAEIPLLFETPQNDAFDVVLVVSAPAFLQCQRALRRPGMTRARLGSILARQMPDSQKRRRADAVIPTGLGKRETLRRLMRSLKLASG
jgi:dephospho-CoA kinase